jgi:Conjugative transposon protein TcpC
MVRRSTVDRSPQSDEYDADYAAGTGDLAPGGGKKDRTIPGWRGAGGRWLIWVFRIVVWAVLLLIGYRGVTAIMTGETNNSPAPAPAASPGSGFPTTLAGAYALQFGQVYLNADPATASQRASQLATFLPAGSDPQLGWNGSGSLQLQSEQVASVAVSDAHHAVVTLLARVNGQLMELGVPVYYSGGALAVSGEPAWPRRRRQRCPRRPRPPPMRAPSRS